MIRIRANHEVKTKAINGDYMSGRFFDGLYASHNGRIYITARGKGKSHFATVGGSLTVCNRKTAKMSSAHTLTTSSNPLSLCKNCKDAAKSLGLRFVSGGWYDIPLMARLHTVGMLKDGLNRLINHNGIKPFEMTQDMNNPYVSALLGGERLSRVDTKAYSYRNRKLTRLNELHDVVLCDIVEIASKSKGVAFDLMKFYPVTSAFDFGGHEHKLSDELENARSFLGYDSLEAGVLFMKSHKSLDVYNTIAFKVSDRNGSGVISVSWVPHDKPLQGQMSNFDVCVSQFGFNVKSNIGCMQKWVI